MGKCGKLPAPLASSSLDQKSKGVIQRSQLAEPNFPLLASSSPKALMLLESHSRFSQLLSVTFPITFCHYTLSIPSYAPFPGIPKYVVNVVKCSVS